MSFDKDYPNRKDRRKQYFKSGKFDRSCRCHGGCPYCEANRLHSTKVREESSKEIMDDYNLTTSNRML